MLNEIFKRPYAGNPHVRFVGGEVASPKSRRGFPFCGKAFGLAVVKLKMFCLMGLVVFVNEAYCESNVVTWAGAELGQWNGHVFSCDVRPTPTMVVEFTLDSSCADYGNVRWLWNGESKPRTEDVRYIDVTTPGKPRTYRVKVLWKPKQGDRITGLLLDLPTKGRGSSAQKLLKLAVIDTARAEPIDASVIKAVSFSCKMTKPGRGRVRWMREDDTRVYQKHFNIPADGIERKYSVELSEKDGWKGKIVWIELCDVDGHRLPARDVVYRKTVERLPLAFAIMSARAADGVNRVGTKTPIEVVVLNSGSVPLRDVRIRALRLPGNATETDHRSRIARLAPGDVDMLEIDIVGLTEGRHEMAFEVSADGLPPQTVNVPVHVQGSLGLAQCDYVPEPHPIESDYEIGALYFPGWTPAFRNGTAWKAIWTVCPERKPILGWYDEADPEAVDWHLKYLAESGIRFLLVDWYWDRGKQQLTHFIDAYSKARYRKYVKWAVHWCNHNAPGSHSMEDMKSVVRYWIDNYFRTPEYYTIDGKPVVMIYSSEGFERDLGAGGCRKALDMMREEAVKEGLSGICFLTMKWNERTAASGVIHQYADWGFDMTTIYHYMEHDGNVNDPEKFDFAAAARSNPSHWNRLLATGCLPFLPHISTGWDSRPWQEQTEIYGKNVEDFRSICVAARDFMDRTGIRRFVLSPLNEWGEGSYAEPNAEFGFGFYRTVREVFGKKPVGGWGEYVMPKDVGLGPYEFPVRVKDEVAGK